MSEAKLDEQTKCRNRILRGCQPSLKGSGLKVGLVRVSEFHPLLHSEDSPVSPFGVLSFPFFGQAVNRFAESQSVAQLGDERVCLCVSAHCE